MAAPHPTSANAAVPPLSSSSAASVSYARRDGRTALELRGKEMRLSEMADFDGSCWYAQGQTAVMVSLHGPTLAKNEAYDTCLVRVRVQHARGIVPSAGGAERAIYEEMKSEVLTRTDALELTSLLESSIDAVFMRDRFPRCVLVVDVVVVQDDGSLPAVALNAVMCALLDAGLPCRTTMAAVCVAAMGRSESNSSSDANQIHKNKNNSADASARQLEFVLDPTSAEENVGAPYGASSTPATAAVAAEKGDLTSTTNTTLSSSTHNMSVLNRDAAQAAQEQYRCVSAGVFVFSNPACGGGLLAQLVQRRTGASSGTAAVAPLTVQAYGQMMTLAERAATVLFDFFRQCNVAE